MPKFLIDTWIRFVRLVVRLINARFTALKPTLAIAFSWRTGRSIAIGLVLTLISLTVLSFNIRPAWAEVNVSPRLREQVLQIIRENPEALIESVQAYQQQQQAELQQVRQAFLQQVAIDPDSVIGQSPITSDPTNKILLIEFSDFQCPYCAQSHTILKQFLAKHQTQVTLTYKHFPLTELHDQALPAAQAAWAAQQQGKFWEYHDALFSQQDQLSESLYTTIAQSLKLDLDQFNRDRQSTIAETAIQQDIQLATQLGITGTPFLIFNQQVLTGAIDLPALENLLSKS